MRAQAAQGSRVMKLHPTVQAFYPDDSQMMPVYEEAQRLGLVIFFHGGRAGIEPESRQRYAMPRHYEAVLAQFPRLQVIIGHGGARVRSEGGSGGAKEPGAEGAAIRLRFRRGTHTDAERARRWGERCGGGHEGEGEDGLDHNAAVRVKPKGKLRQFG